ncbi:MAG: FlgD immunoglobulin-like domain containing protein [Candidatus Edwardsbacteria bacterium]
MYDVYLIRLGLKAPVLFSPPNGSLTNDNTPFFDWSDVTGATKYQIQIDDDGTFTTPVKDTIVSVSDYTIGTPLTDSVYYWRVRAGDAANNWSVYSNAWNFTVDTSAPAIPTLVSPPNGSLTNDNTPSFYWRNASGASKYQIQIDGDSLFASPVKDTVVSDTNYTIGLSLSDGVWYWRVRAGDAANNWSVYSNAWNFTVDTAPPATPSLISPSAGSFTCGTPTFVWGSVSDGNKYQIQIDNNSDFTSPEINIVLPDTAYTPTASLLEQTYFWHVRAEDVAGNPSVYSPAWQFTVETQFPQINPLTLDRIAKLDNPFRCEAKIWDVGSAGIDYAAVSCRKGGSGSGYNCHFMTLPPDSLGWVDIPNNEVTLNGLEYYFEVADKAGNITYYPSGKDTLPYSHPVHYYGLAMPSLYPYDAWYILSFPGSSFSPNPDPINFFEDDLGSYDKTKWRCFRYVDDATGYVEAPDARVVFKPPGRALWLRHRIQPSPTLDIPDSGTTIRTGSPYSINLAPGWNDIATPFFFSVDWNRIKLATGNDSIYLRGLYTYDGNSWQYPIERLEPFKGYAVKNISTGTISLKIPPLSSPPKGKADNLAEFMNQIVDVKVSGPAGEDKYNYFGIIEDAKQEYDSYDYPEPPSGLTEISGYFDNCDWKEFPDRYASDFRPPSAEGQVWKFTVEGNEEAKIQWDIGDKISKDNAIYLFDPKTSVAIDLRKNSEYEFAFGSGETKRDFTLAMGSEEFVLNHLKSLKGIPKATILFQNYPNPFSSQTAIRYSLSAISHTTLKIYNVAGQLVKTLVNERCSPGYYSMNWDGKDESGKRVADGVYFYRLETSNFSATKKMILLR